MLSVRLAELLNSDESRQKFDCWTLLGFGALDLNELYLEKTNINAIFVPIYKGLRLLQYARELTVDIKHLGYLAARMQFAKGNEYSRIVRKNYLLEIHAESIPEIVICRDIPVPQTWCSDHFRAAYHQFFNSRFCRLKAKTVNDSWVDVFVSCAELLRFYYPHTALVDAAFSNSEPEDSLFNPKIPKEKSFRPFVQLRKTIPDICAPYVARIRHCEYARKAYQDIHWNSTLNPDNLVNGEEHLIVYPPIKGVFSWQVEARQLNKDALLITGIQRCNAPFPFEELLFGRDNDGRRSANDPPPKEFNPRPVKRPMLDGEDLTKKGEGHIPTSLNEMADVQIETLSIEFDFEATAPSFGYLESMLVKKIEKASVKNPDKINVQVFDGYEAIAGITVSGFLNTGDENKFAKAEISNGKLKKSNLSNEQFDVSLFSSFDTFRKAVNNLKDEYIVNWKIVCFSFLPSTKFYLNAFSKKEIGSCKFLYLSKRLYTQSESREEQLRYTRKFVVAEISLNDKYLYFVDFEKRTVLKRSSSSDSESKDSTSILLFHSTGFNKMESPDIKKTVLSYANDRRGWAKKEGRIEKRNLTHHSKLKELGDKLRRNANKLLDD